MPSCFGARSRHAVLLSAAVLAIPSLVRAQTISGVQPAALDQPRINAYISLTGTPDAPIAADFGGGVTSFNIEAYFDTGASGILLSEQTAELLAGTVALPGIQRITYGGSPVIYYDIGVGNVTSDFAVSNQLHIALAPYHPDALLDTVGDLSAYSQHFTPMRAQIGPINVADPDPALEGLDVFGTPLMQGKVVVMDPKPVNTLLDTMRTYVYNPGTPYNAAAADTNPGIPTTDRHVQLSKVNFADFTDLSPAGAKDAGLMPTLATNPFIGKNPADNSGTARGIALTLGTTTLPDVSFLLDTGAGASMISSGVAGDLGVEYDPDAPADNPSLRYKGSHAPVDNQFQLSITGIGGTKKVAGFFMDSLVLPTTEGLIDPTKDITFDGAPVLVADITTHNPTTGQDVTIPGIFGDNFLVGSAFVSEGDPFPIIDNLTYGPFSWITYDQDNGVLGLTIAPVDAQPTLMWTGTFDLTGEDPNHNHWNINFTSAFSIGFAKYHDGDHVQFGDFIMSNADANVHIDEPVAPGSVLIENTNVFGDGVVLYTFLGPGYIRGMTGLTKKGSGSVLFLTSNTYTGTTDVQAGTVTFGVPQNIGPVGVRTGGTVIMQTSQRFESLDLAGGHATLTAGANKVLNLTDLSISTSDGGTLDLNDNDMVIRSNSIQKATLLSDVTGWVKKGLNLENNGYWNGPGITSTTAITAAHAATALGAIVNDDGTGTPLYATFSGVSDLDANTMLVKYTWFGDSDLDGKITRADYMMLDVGAAAGGGKSGWRWGDFNYDGTINGLDYALIDNAALYGGTTTTLADQMITLHSATLGADYTSALAALENGTFFNTSVPEPGTTALVVAALAGWTLRRRRTGLH